MHHDFLDKYRDRVSPWSECSVMFRLCWSLLFVIATATIPAGRLISLLVMITLLALSAASARLPFGFFLSRSLGLSIPAWLIALPMALFQPRGGAWLLFMAAKAWCAVGMMTVLISTTSFPEILNTLRRLRCPELLLSLLGFTYRYIFLLVDESERLHMTYKARVAAAPNALKRRALSGIAGTLFARSLERSDRIYDAMLARGFDGRYPGIPAARITVVEGMILTALLLITIGARFIV
ncbi:MAG: energy-coupling factor transporter transmembrane component T [Candidatus Edwardsbacteria bacterium]|nr:energy-coupling factor transporter transmembrane component T [Candidatus Edwardsbacteria bacterium]